MAFANFARRLIGFTLILSAFAACKEQDCGDATGCSAGADPGGGGNGGADACSTEGAFQACQLANDPAGQPSGGQQCTADADGNLAWNECQPASSAASTPLVLSFDGAPVEMKAGAAAFDINGTMSVVTDWPTAATPWLALDRNGNGAIDDGGELFGSATKLGSGARAPNGFAALAELDSDGDGRITPADAAWASLRLWSDRDGDRFSASSELGGLDARGVISIDLDYTSARRCDARQNCEIERASFRWVDASGVTRTGAIIDVHLKHQ
ncbi:hemolysin-type calcium binding protein [Minicystis rosea]|nr:hemolysin-type calcium binding protein [Minicystis rosea]